MKLVSGLRGGLGVLAATLFLALLTSGWGLMPSYVPTDREAFDSVLYLRKLGGAGAFLRAVHVLGASLLVSVGALYLLATYVAGAAPREKRAWFLALALFGSVLFLCFTGFLLPMDQNAYWGTLVRFGIIETASGVGPPAADFLRGGGALNASTLPRFYALHVGILPFVAAALLAALLWDARERLKTIGLSRLLATALLLLLVLYALSAALPAPLEPRAAPGDTEYVPRPEWYFLWLFQFGKYVEAWPWVRSLLLPALAAAAVVAAAFRTQSETTRRSVAGAVVVGFVLLTGLARYDDRALPAKPSHEQALRARAGFLFKEECSSCHGETGKGDGTQAKTFDLAVPDMNGAAFWKDQGDDRMRDAIRNGKGEDMPAFGKKMTAEEIDALVVMLGDRFRPK